MSDGFKKVLEDEKESFVLKDGQLVPKAQAKNKLQEAAKVEAPAPSTVKAPAPAKPIADDGTAMGKLKARKAEAAIEAAKQKARKRVQEITKTEQAKYIKVATYEELAALVEEAAEMYQDCDFEIGQTHVNFISNGQSKTVERFLIGVTKGTRRRETNIRADEVTYENVIQFLDEASN